MTDQPEPIRKSDLPCIPPPEWDFHTWFPTPDGGGDMVPGQFQRGVQVRRRVSYGDWEPVRPDRWAEEPAQTIPDNPAASGDAVDTLDPQEGAASAACGLPHYDYPQSLCREPVDHAGCHAARLVIDGVERGGVAWDVPASQPQGSQLTVEQELADFRSLLAEAVEWIHEGELRERICDALDPQGQP